MFYYEEVFTVINFVVMNFLNQVAGKVKRHKPYKMNRTVILSTLSVIYSKVMYYRISNKLHLYIFQITGGIPSSLDMLFRVSNS